MDYVGLMFLIGLPIVFYGGLRFRYSVRRGHPPPWPLDLAMAVGSGLFMAFLFWYFQPPA